MRVLSWKFTSLFACGKSFCMVQYPLSIGFSDHELEAITVCLLLESWKMNAVFPLIISSERVCQ